MFVVIFRAKLRAIDDEYRRMASRLRELALGEHGCVEFLSMTEGSDEVALSYWRDEASIAAWKKHGEHVMAQELGRTRWYEAYSVEVARVERAYRGP